MLWLLQTIVYHATIFYIFHYALATQINIIKIIEKE